MARAMIRAGLWVFSCALTFGQATSWWPWTCDDDHAGLERAAGPHRR
jgi:hypothetical protein